MNILNFYKGVEQIFKIVYRAEITLYDVKNQISFKKENILNPDYLEVTDISKLISTNSIIKLCNLDISGGFNNTLNKENYKSLEKLMEDNKDYVISLSVFNYNKTTSNSINIIVKKSNYTVYIQRNLIGILNRYEEIILGESIGMLVGDEMGSLENILVIGEDFFHLNFKKIYNGIKFLYKLNPSLKKTPISYHLARLNIIDNMVFDKTDKCIETTLQAIFFLHIKGVSEDNLERLFNSCKKNHLSSKILSLTNNIINTINFKKITVLQLNKISDLQFNKQTFIKLLPINKKIDLNEEFEESHIIFLDKDDLLVKIQEDILIHNIKNNSLKNIDILQSHFINHFINNFITNKMNISKDNINYNFIKDLIANLKINFILGENGYEVTSLKNLGILINNIKGINIEDVTRKILKDKRYKEDNLIMKPILNHFNLKMKKEKFIKTADINKFIFIYYKDVIFKNINSIMVDLGYKKSIFKVGKNIILKLLDNDEGVSKLLHKTPIENFSKEIYWYKKNISDDKVVIEKYLSQIAKGTTISDDYKQNVISVLYGIHTGNTPISYNALKKLNTFFLDSENKIGSHNTYMDRFIYGMVLDKLLFENIILKSNDLEKVKDVIGKINLGRNFLRNLGTFDFGDRKDLKEMSENHILSIIKEIKGGNIDIADTIQDYINNFENTLLEYKKYSKKDLKHYIRNRRGLDNSLTYIQLINKTFDGDTDFFNKLKTLTKNITSGSLPHIKSIVFYRKNQLLITGFDRLKELIGSKDKKGDAINPGKMFKDIKLNYPDVLGNIKNNIPPNDKKIKELLYKYDKNTKNIITFYIKLENILNEQYWCAGDYSNCCMGHTYEKQKTYIWDKGFHIINIYMNNKVIANSLVFIAYINGVKTLVLDSFERNNTYNNFIPFYKEYFIQYIEHLKLINGCNDAILSGYLNEHNNKIFPNKRNPIEGNKVKPLGVKYFENTKNKLLFNKKSKFLDKNTSLFQKFKDYCYSDFSLTSIHSI